jgi:hypothetical protein
MVSSTLHCLVIMMVGRLRLQCDKSNWMLRNISGYQLTVGLTAGRVGSKPSVTPSILLLIAPRTTRAISPVSYSLD